MPKVSVVIPTYNRESFIEETIESVLNQTFKDFEIIVVDDGSTDNTKEKLKRFGTKIKLIEQKNSERAVSRNNGVKNSNSEYIAFLDSDDIWIKDKLEKQVNILNTRPNVILAYGQCLRINEKSKPIKIAKRQLNGFSGRVYENLLLRNFITSPTPLVRREYFNKTSGFQSQYIPYEDWEYWIRFSLMGDFHFIEEPVAYYRVHKEQSVQNTNAKKIEDVTTSLLEDSFKLDSVSKEVKNKSLGLANLRFCYWYLASSQNDIAKEKLNNAISHYPAFSFDPRWHGLALACNFPQLLGKGIFNLEQYH